MRLEDRVLLVDKPAGVTSFGVVRQLRRILHVQKVGHCGSLDPMATGLLVVCTGRATRVSSIFVDRPKEYWARIRLGRATDSYDADGVVTDEGSVPPFEVATLEQALRRFEGTIEQLPPMVSALKVRGRRLYELARRGETVERAPRRVQVHGLHLVDFGAEHLDLRVECGRGFYVRSLAHDLGRVLGVPAHLEKLRRTAIGSFRVESARTLEVIEKEHPKGALSVAGALSFLPVLHVRQSKEESVRNGVQPDASFLCAPVQEQGPHLLLSEDATRLLGLVRSEPSPEIVRLRLLCIFQDPLPTNEETNPA